MPDTALIFPGQGAQKIGMGKALHDEFPIVRDTFEEASDAVGIDLAALCFDGPIEKLSLTQYTQPCVLTTSIAAFRVLTSEIDFSPIIAAGHSLGEYSALAASGVISFPDAVAAVHNRGKWMDEAVPDGTGCMAAVLKSTPEEVEKACEEASGQKIVVPANDNAPGQIVISGHKEAVEAASALLKENGGKVRALNVSGPFHTEMMEPAVEKMKDFISELKLGDFSFPVIANVTAKTYVKKENVSDRLSRQLTLAVRWRECVIEMDKQGARLYIESGPGSVLSGLVKRTLDSPQVLPMNEPSHIDAIREALQNGG
jgi:[acyl-carrier-protein] S-malonyltransferase